MQSLPVFALLVVAAIHTPLAVRRSDSLLVRAVTSGDTISVQSIGRVRLLGIDAPALGRNPGAQAPLAREARDRLADLVLGHWVRLETEGEPDSASGWRHAYVWREDGLFVNAVLVREGLARATARRGMSHAAELERAEREARAFGRGLWGQARRPASGGVTRTPRLYCSVDIFEAFVSWQRSPLNTRPSGESGTVTSSTTASTTGRSGSSSS